MRIITAEKLAELYRTMTNKQLCKYLNISNPTLMAKLRANNIPLKGRGNAERKLKVIA